MSLRWGAWVISQIASLPDVTFHIPHKVICPQAHREMTYWERHIDGIEISAVCFWQKELDCMCGCRRFLYQKAIKTETVVKSLWGNCLGRQREMLFWLFTHSLGSVDYGERLKVEQRNSHGVPALSVCESPPSQPTPKTWFIKTWFVVVEKFSKFHAETTNWGANDEW